MGRPVVSIDATGGWWSDIMRMNRRNVLAGLGGIVAGGGALLGTGAFSSVSADRTVSIKTAGDGSGDAMIGIDLTGDLAGSAGDTITFDLAEDVNLDAVTRFEGVLEITNNRETQEDSVDIDILDDSDTSLIADSTAAGDGLGFEPESSGAHEGLDGAGGSVTFDVVFDLTGVTTTANGDSAIPGSITIEATPASGN